MADNTNVTIHINGNTSGLDKAVGKATEDFDKLHQSVKKTSDEGNNLPSISKKLDMGNLMEASESLSGIGDGIIEIGTKSIEAAGKAQAMQAQFQQVFGGLAGEAQKSVNSMAEKFGMLPNTVKPIFTQYTSMFKGLGMSTEDAMKKAGDATTMAADAAAFYDKSMDEASSGLNSFIKGNYEGGESIGLFANDTQMAAFAVSQGVVGATKDWASLDEATKQATRLEYAKNMQEQAGAVGQAARESDGLENQMGRAKQALEDFYASIGKDILPTFIKVLQSGVKVIQNMAKWWGQLDQPMKIFIGSIAGIIAALTTLAPIITAIVTVVGTFGAGVLLPMIGIIAGIAAAIAVVVTVVQNWGTITDWISEKWSAFVDWLGGIWDSIKSGASGVWDSIKEGAGNLWEGVKQTWQGFLDWVSEKWNGLITWFSKLWTSLVEGASNIWEGVKGTWQGFVDWATNIWQGVQATWQVFLDWVTNAWNAVKEAWSIIWADIVGIVKIPWTIITALIQASFNIIVGIFDVAGQLLRVAWEAIWTPISEFLTNTWNTITAFLSNSWNNIVTTLHSVFDPIGAWFATIWNNILTTLTNTWNTISQTAIAIWTPIQNFIINVSHVIMDGIVSIWNSVVSWLTGTWNTISSTASALWNVVKSTVLNLVQATKDGIVNIWNAVTSWLTGKWNAISSVASSIWNGMKTIVYNTVQATKDGITSVWSSITGWLSSQWNNIKNTASSLWNGIKSTVTNIVQGTKNSISSIWGGLASMVGGYFQNAKNTIANIWEGVKDTVMRPIDWVRDKISNIFSNLNISIPHIPLPHFKLSGEFNPLKGKIPSIGIDWYAKGGVFTKPTLLGGMNGVGEAGPEAVLPLRDNILAKIGNQILRATGVTAPNQETNSTVNNYNVVVNVDGDQSTSLTDRVTDSVVKGITKVQIRESRAWS